MRMNIAPPGGDASLYDGLLLQCFDRARLGVFGEFEVEVCMVINRVKKK